MTFTLIHSMANPLMLSSAAGALALALYLVSTVKVRPRLSGTPQPDHIRELVKRLEELEQRQREHEERLPEAPGVMPVRPGINLSRRSQALRLYRRGTRPDEIARMLEAPLGEVRLLLKVHRIQMEHALGPPELKTESESADKLSSTEKVGTNSLETR